MVVMDIHAKFRFLTLSGYWDMLVETKKKKKNEQQQQQGEDEEL